MRAPVYYGQGAVGKAASAISSTYQAVLLCLTLLLSSPVVSAAAINSDLSGAAVGQLFPDFTLASTNAEAGQRLLEQRGAPVMVLVLDKCNRCEKSLQFFADLASRYQAQDMVSWVVWTPYKKHQPPRMNIPVLNNHSSAAQSFANERPQLYLINRDGTLAHRLSGSLRNLAKTTEPILESWMHTQVRPVKP